MSTIFDESEYIILRRQVLALATPGEHARANRIASQMDSSQIHNTIDPLVKAKLLKRQNTKKSIIVHYTYERRFAYYQSKMHDFWNAQFNPSTGVDARLIVGTRNNPNLVKELVRRSPLLSKQTQNHEKILLRK